MAYFKQSNIIVVFTIFCVSLVLCASLPIDTDTVIVDKDKAPIENNNQLPTVEIAREKICTLPVQRGHCRALLPRWRYNPKTKRCHEFKFGGCDGNGNNFMTEKDCMKLCQGV